jgi:hypothetical protein
MASKDGVYTAFVRMPIALLVTSKNCVVLVLRPRIALVLFVRAKLVHESMPALDQFKAM